MKHAKVATLIAAGLVALGAMSPARAQSGTIGYVDMEKVFNAADAKKAGEDRVNSLAQRLQERERALQEAKLLPSSTWQQYKTLMEKDKPTDADTKELASIKDQLTKLDRELTDLQNTPQLSDAQKTRLNELNGNGTANLGNLQSVDADYGQQIAKLQTDLRNNIVADIQKAAKKVADDKKIAIVLNKQVAVGDDVAQLLVVAGGVELTDDVIKQVNASRK